MCKRATGGGFAVLVQARKSSLRWVAGKPFVYRSSATATRGFCGTCGAPLFLQYDGDKIVRLTVGLLDRPGDIFPGGHYGVKKQARLADLGAGLPMEKHRSSSNLPPLAGVYRSRGMMLTAPSYSRTTDFIWSSRSNPCSCRAVASTSSRLTQARAKVRNQAFRRRLHLSVSDDFNDEALHTMTYI